MATKALTAQIKDKQEYMARATPPFIMSIISLSTHQKLLRNCNFGVFLDDEILLKSLATKKLKK